MKEHMEIIEKYDKWLENESVYGMFEITDFLVMEIFFKYMYPDTKIQHIPSTFNVKCKAISRQLNFTRLSLLRVKYYRNGWSAKGIKEGFVYGVSNPAYPEYLKIGSSISATDRLEQYQTYSPFRDYTLECYYFSNDRYTDEKQWHNALPNKGEWCECDKEAIKVLFEQNKKKDITSLKEKLVEYIKRNNIDV